MTKKKKNPPKRRTTPAIEVPLRQPIAARVAIAKSQGRSAPKGKSTLTPPSQQQTMQWLRFSAGLYYTTDFQGTTVEKMAKHPIYGAVKLTTLRTWCAEDRWVTRRSQNLERWREAIERKIASEIVKARQDQLERLRAIFDKTAKKLEDDVVEPKSYEGLMQALVKLASLMDEWNEKLGRAIIPDMPIATPTEASIAAPQTKPQLTDAEARESAKVIMSMRRQRLRESIVREQTEEAGKPTLEVIEGEK